MTEPRITSMLTTAALLFSLVCSGCASNQGPRRSEIVAPLSDVMLYTTTEWGTDLAAYNSAFDSYVSDPTNAVALQKVSVLRNKMINRLRTDIRSAHHEYELKLTKSM